MSDDDKAKWVAASQMLAGDNARLCGIVLEADNLAELLEWLDRGGGLGLKVHDRIRAALDAYRIQRQGS